MKILLLMDNPTIPTGYASTCRLTARELMKRGYQVWATAFNGGRVIREPEEWNGIRVVPNYALDRDPHAIYGDAECVRRICDEIKPDILFWHNDSYRYSYMSQLPKEILDRSVFWLPFEGENADMLGVGLFSRCAATRFVTRYALDLHRQHLSGKDIGYIPHAIGVDRLTPIDQAQKRAAKADKQYGIEDKFVVVRVDRHQPRKYWDRSLRAFAKFAEGKDDVFFLAKCNPKDVTMYSVKDGRPTGLDLGTLASDLGIARKVKFDDFFFDDSFMARAFLHPADVFLTTTSGEGFGLCPAEAMACGIPVLAPDTPVLPEVLGGDDDRDAGGGIFAKLEGRTFYDAMQVWHNLVDVDDVAAKLEWAYRDWKAGGKELALIGARGRKIALDRYDPKVVYDQWHQVFTDIAVKDDLVSMVTVLYNLKGEDQISGEDGIGKFRETVEKHVTTPYEWIMVDNGSPQRDVTRKWMREAAHANPRIKPIFLDVNMGYAGGNNAGIAAAKGNWIVLANPDSEALDHNKQIQPGDFMKMLVDTAKADPKVGIVGMEINDRPDVMPGLSFPYFCCVLVTRKCLDAIRDKDGKWLDESFWPAYYEDACLCLRARQKGFKIVENKGTTFWHKSGGTNKHAIEGGRDGPHVAHLKAAIDILEKAHADMADWPRKRGELASDGMQGLIRGNIRALNKKYGVEARKGIKVVWHVHVGDGVGFSQIAEGLAPKMEEAGFDVYVNDWSNGRNIEDPAVRRLWEKYRKANLGDGLDNAIHIVCWLMETFLNVDANFKIGISLCESTKVRSSYLHACNSMDRILTFSEFCRKVQIDSGYEVPIDIIAPGVNPIYLRHQDRPRRKDKFSFLSVGVAQGRKETHKLVELFCETFPKGSDRDHLPDCEPGFPYDGGQVELILKSNNFGELGWVEPYKQRANIRTIFTGQDKRAERQDFSTEEMRALYDEVDCLVHPSHGEGVGYPLVESAATGLPIIFTNWSSPAEYFDESNSYPCSLSPYPGTTFTKAYPGAPGDNGLWANCLAPGSPIRTRTGMKPIEEVQEGDYVLTDKGRYRRVTHKFSRRYSGEIVRIRGMLNSHEIVVTPEHPILCVKTENCHYKRRDHVTCKPNCGRVLTAECSDKLHEKYVREYVEAKDLKKRDALLLPFIGEERELEPIDMLEYAGDKVRHDDEFVWLTNLSHHDLMNSDRVTIFDVANRAGVSRSVAQRGLLGGEYVSEHALDAVLKSALELRYEPNSDFKKIKRFVSIDEQFGRLCGFYLAEGDSRKSNVSFTFNANETTYVNEVQEIMREKFGIGGSANKNGENAVSIIFCSAILARMFTSLFGKYARNKHMPESWAYLPKPVAKGILYGYWRGDGTLSNLTLSYKTASPCLAYQTNAICLKLGIVAGIHINSIGQYDTRIAGEENTRNASVALEIDDFDRKSIHDVNWRDEDYAYLPIRSICRETYDGPVFNLEVEEDNTYCCAHAIVHNCHVGHFKHLMRQVVRNPEEARQKGIKASEHMAKNFNWNNTANQMVPMMFEWEEQRRMKENKEQFNALTYQKPSLEPVRKGDRVLVDICTRDRHLPLSCLLVSLRAQTFKDWDVLVQCDDSDESMPNDFMVMSIMGRLQHEGHGWRIIRGHRQGPHIGHDRSLQMAADDPNYKYKLVCRIDDDIIVDPTYLESLIEPFYGDEKAEIAAVGGVYLDPKRTDAEQTAPADFRTSVEYAGIIDHNVPWPYVCRYPEGTGLREVEHLYSSFMYRVEVGVSIGGYCKKLSQVGHREESDFSYRFHLAGYRQYIQPKAVGYHFCVPAGGIRAGDIVDKGTLAAADHQIYVNRIAKWKRQLEQRRRLEAGQEKAPDADAGQKPEAEPRAPTVTKGKMAAVINGGRDVPRIQRAIDRLSGIANEIYVTCEDEGAKVSLFGDRLAMVACSPDESAMLARQLASAGDHEFVMTVPDTLVFQRDPRPMLDDSHDNYVFEVYRTYIPGRHRQDGGQSVFVQDDGIGTVIGPECRNMCLICRRGAPAPATDIGRTKYLDMLAWEDERLAPVDGKSIAGNDLLPVRDMERVNWRKVCTYQFPEGKLKEPFYMDVKASDAPLVSIIIPTIDRCKLLKKCIDSIYAFTTTPFEIIIVDNNSSDGTFKLMEEQQFRGNLHGLRLNMNVGYQRAINMGIDNAKGKYLLLFNDDAWVEKYWRDGRDWLRVMIDDLEADPTIGIIGPHEGTSPALGSHVLYFWCVMMKRSFYDEMGPLDDATFFNYGGDDDYCERTRKAGYKVQYKHGYDADGVLRHLMNLVPKEKQAPEIEESRRKLLEKYRK